MTQPTTEAGRRRLILYGLLAGALLIAVVAVAPSLFETTAEGRGLLPYDAYVYEIEILDSFTLYADEEAVPNANVLDGLLLGSLATTAFLAGLLLRRIAPGESRVHRFYLLAGLGAAFLALDELFGIHETVGHNLRFLADLPAVDKPDDVIFAAYALPVLAFLFWFRDVALSSRDAALAFGIALALLAAAAISDLVLHLSVQVEDAFEVLSTSSAFAGVVILALEHVGERLPAPRPTGPP